MDTTLIQGQFRVNEIEGEPLLDGLNQLEQDADFARVANNAMGMLTKYFPRFSTSSQFARETGAEPVEDSSKTIGFTQSIFELGSIIKVHQNDTEWVDIKGRATRPWAKNQRAELLIRFELFPENCKKLAAMLDSPECRKLFTVEEHKEFTHKFNSTETMDLSPGNQSRGIYTGR